MYAVVVSIHNNVPYPVSFINISIDSRDNITITISRRWRYESSNHDF